MSANLNSKCRTCLSVSNSYHQLNDYVEGNYQILGMLNGIVPQINIRNTTPFSSTICQSCVDKLLTGYKFQQLCLETNQRLHDLLGVALFEPNHTVKYALTGESSIKVEQEFVDDASIECEFLWNELVRGLDSIPNADDGNDTDSSNEQLSVLKQKLAKEGPLKCKNSKNSSPSRLKDLMLANKTVCNICKKVFLSSSKLKEHMATHSVRSPYLCTKCSKTFHSWSSLRLHIRRHMFLKKYQCPERSIHLRRKSEIIKPGREKKIQINTGNFKNPNKLTNCRNKTSEPHEFFAEMKFLEEMETQCKENINSRNKFQVKCNKDIELPAKKSAGVNNNCDNGNTSDFSPDTINDSTTDTSKTSNLSDRFTQKPEKSVKENTSPLDITKVTVPYSGKRKKHFCIFCKTLQSKLARHLLLIHKSEKQIKAILNFPKKNKERLKVISQLRKEGDFIHNTTESLNSGILIVSRQQQRKFKNTALDYVCCKNCKGFFSKKTLRAHINKCGESKKNDRTNFISSRMLTQNIHKDANAMLKTKIFPVLRDDEITNIIRFDDLIIKFGNKLAEKYAQTRHHEIIRSRLRLLGRFKIAIKQLSPDIKELKQIFKPQLFEIGTKAVRKVANWDNLIMWFKTPAVATSLTSLIKKCAFIQRLEYIKAQEDDLRKKLDDFLILWQDKLPTLIKNNFCEDQTNQKTNKNNIDPPFKERGSSKVNSCSKPSSQDQTNQKTNNNIQLPFEQRGNSKVVSSSNPSSQDKKISNKTVLPLKDTDNFKADSSSNPSSQDKTNQKTNNNIQLTLKDGENSQADSCSNPPYRDIKSNNKTVLPLKNQTDQKTNNNFQLPLKDGENSKADSCSNPSSQDQTNKKTNNIAQLPLKKAENSKAGSCSNPSYQDQKTYNKNMLPLKECANSKADSCSYPPCKTRSHFGKIKRSRWTEREQNAIFAHFGKLANLERLPTLSECLHLIKKCPDLKKRTPPQIKSWIDNQRRYK